MHPCHEPEAWKPSQKLTGDQFSEEFRDNCLVFPPLNKPRECVYVLYMFMCVLYVCIYGYCVYYVCCVCVGVCMGSVEAVCVCVLCVYVCMLCMYYVCCVHMM